MNGKRKQRLPRSVRLIILLAALGIIAYGCIIAFVCFKEGSVLNEVPPAEQYEAIVVLGAQVKPDGNPSVQLEWRLDAACEAYRQKHVPVVVCGAQGGDEPMPEADAMKLYLVGKGVPETDILSDPESFNTDQNLKNAKRLLAKKADIRNVLIVTSDYHVPRSLALARDNGMNAVGMGSPCKPEYWLKNHAREALAWCKYWAVKYLHLPLN